MTAGGLSWRGTRELGPGPVCLLSAGVVTRIPVGSRTAFIPRPAEYGPHQTQDLRAEHAFDVVATDMVGPAAQRGG